MSTIGLLGAVYRGNEKEVKDLLARGVRPDADKDNSGKTPLIVACEKGHKSIALALISAQANVNHTVNTGDTALFLASFHGHADIVKILLENGANRNAAKPDGWTPLLIATEFKRKEVVKLLVSAGANIDHAGKSGRSVLYIAACNGHEYFTKLFIDHKADVNLRSCDGETPLYIAAKLGRIAVIQMLLQAKADINIQANNGLTPLAIARNRGLEEVVRLLNETTTKPTSHQIIKAIKAGNVNQLKSLLSATTNPNFVDNKGNTLLHLAIKLNQNSALQLLLKCPGIITDYRNKKNETPMQLAIRSGCRELVQIMFQYVDSAVERSIKSNDLVIDYDKVLGCGYHSTVYKATYKNAVVAIKKLRENMVHTNNEVIALKRCRSAYVIRLIGMYEGAHTPPSFVLEYMDGGNLREHLNLKKDGKPTLTNYSNLEIAWVIANGLAEIHDREFIYRDLKSTNVLLSTKHYIKLGDLGSARAIATLMTQASGTPFWVAPEVIRDCAYGRSADIYSFGVVLTELDTLEVPYSNEVSLSEHRIINKVLNESLRPSLSAACPDWWKNLAEKCFAENPNDRPTAKEIIDILKLRLQEKC